MRVRKKIPLSQLRTAKGLSQKDLANVFGCSPSAVCQWETGKRMPSLAMAERISVFFEVPIENIKYGV